VSASNVIVKTRFIVVSMAAQTHRATGHFARRYFVDGEEMPFVGLSPYKGDHATGFLLRYLAGLGYGAKEVVIVDENLNSPDLDGTVEELAEAIIKKPKLMTHEDFRIGIKRPTGAGWGASG
jgi:hypothetical protein